ncbi:MAG TPA: hypothetical protein VM513_35440 [Kofleriaceae bacterium]|nr:hypothetical protein [Kofleriaceae bacterium]
MSDLPLRLVILYSSDRVLVGRHLELTPSTPPITVGRAARAVIAFAMRFPVLAIAVLVCACSSAPKQPASTTEPPPPATTEPSTDTSAGSGAVAGLVPDGGSCLAGGECASGVCEGEGCDASTPGTCVPASRMCTKDLRPYCGCDGVTFRTSGTCPGRRFSKRAACED